MKFQLKLILCVLLATFCLQVQAMNQYVNTDKKVEITKKENTRQFTIIENDTLKYTLNLAMDETGNPQYFYRNIFTPVCYTNECKPVYIDFYWDLLGNYLRYEMPKGKILTKVDHDEFEEKDYQKLADILSRSNSIFADLKMEDLLTKGTDSLTDNVDAKTGATLKTIKNDVIDGAVYTCYTLWHIAYGKLIINEMNKITNTYLDDKLLHTFLASSNYHYQYRAMDDVIDSEGFVKKSFEKDLENIITGKNLFTARTALQRVGNGFLQTDARQSWLWKAYGSSSYPMQIAILKRLANVSVKPEILNQISAGTEQSNSEQFKLKMVILANQKQLPSQSLQALLPALNHEQYGSQVYDLIKKSDSKNPTVKAKLKQFENAQSN